MNLTALFRKDAAIVDHEWMESGLTQPTMPDGSVFDLDQVKNPNNVKPELEIQWGKEGQDIPLEEPAGFVERNIPEDALGDADEVILFARDMMNRGLMGEHLGKAIRSKFSKEAIRFAGKGLRKQIALEGIVGCIAVDGRGYGNCRDALKAAEHSPYKRFIKHVIGCECGDPHHIPASGRGILGGAVGKTSGNAMDDFLASSDCHKTTFVAHCRSTMLPILSNDLDPSEVDSGLSDMTTTVGLPEGIADKLRTDWTNGKYASGKAVLQAAFRHLQIAREEAEAKRYAGTVSTKEHRVKASEMDVQVAAAAPAPLAVDGSNPYLAQEVIADKPYRTNFDGPKSLGAEMIAELADIPDRSQIHVELQAGKDVKLAPKREAKAPIAVDRRNAELEVIPDLFEGQEVDMAPLLEDEFADTDVFDLEEEGTPVGELGIEFGGESGGITF